MGVFKYSPVDFLLTCMGLVFLLLDIALDTWAVVSFYQEKAYFSLGILLLFLLGSSFLVQAFSWLWYSYEDFRRETRVEKCPSVTQLKLLHVLQMGIYLRHAGVVEISLRSFFSKSQGDEDLAVFLSHDLSMLRLIETFSESAPQLVLMLTIILQRGQLDYVTVLKAIGSASAVAFSVTMYHLSLRSFLEDAQKQLVTSSVVYFLWNLFLIASRLVALALFASVQPCYIFTHFFCSWLVLFFFAWRCKTDFMEGPPGEWLYQATIGLIWYFNWFNVVKGRTRYRTLLYHGYILTDISLLCSLWCWRNASTKPPYFQIPHLYAVITAVSVVAVYTLGLYLKLIYYKCYHPNLKLKEITTEKSQTGQEPTGITACSGDEVDNVKPSPGDQEVLGMPIMLQGGTDIADRSFEGPPAPEIKRCSKKRRKVAENIYS